MKHWAQVGAGIYRVDPLLEFMGEKLDPKWDAGVNVGTGFDYEANRVPMSPTPCCSAIFPSTCPRNARA